MWKNFPKDYSVTLSRFYKECPNTSKRNERIETCSNPEIGNLKIFSMCLVPVQKDNDLLIFCDIVEGIIDNPKLSKIMQVLRKGKAVVLWIHIVQDKCTCICKNVARYKILSQHHNLTINALNHCIAVSINGRCGQS